MKTKESTALIRLTKSEIESVIIALSIMQQSAETFNQTNDLYWKIKDDFIKIKNDIINGEANNES